MSKLPGSFQVPSRSSRFQPGRDLSLCLIKSFQVPSRFKFVLFQVPSKSLILFAFQVSSRLCFQPPHTPHARTRARGMRATRSSEHSSGDIDRAKAEGAEVRPRRWLANALFRRQAARMTALRLKQIQHKSNHGRSRMNGNELTADTREMMEGWLHPRLPQSDEGATVAPYPVAVLLGGATALPRSRQRQ